MDEAMTDQHKEIVRRSQQALNGAVADALIARYEEVTGKKATERLYEKILDAVEYP